MCRVFGKFGLFTALAFLMLLGTGAKAQDLGSSSGVFRTPSSSPKPSKSKPATSAAKKTTPKSAPRTAQKAAASKPSSTKTKTGEKNQSRPTQARVQSTQPVVPSNIVITVGNPNNSNSSANFDEQFEQAVDEGNTARDDRDYVRAESAYRRAQGIKPRDSRAVYGLGNIFADQQRWEEAERSYRAAIALEPDSAGAYIALSYVLTQPIAGITVSDRYDEAEKSARKAIQLDPTNAFAFDQLGVALELRGIISRETREAYLRAIEIDPEFALAYAHLGRLLRRNGKDSDSADAYSKAIRFSTDVPTMILVAEVMQSQQRFSESEQLLRRALAVDAKNPTALNMLGRALTTRGEFDEAETVLSKSILVSPSSFVSYALLSSLYLRRARPDDAERTLGRALSVVSANEKKRLAQDYEAVGDFYMKAGRVKDAQRNYRQALSLDGSKTALTEKLSNMK